MQPDLGAAVSARRAGIAARLLGPRGVIWWSLTLSTWAAEERPLVLSEDFSQPVASIQEGLDYKKKTGWRVRSGQWDFVEGALRGQQKPTDNRGAFVVYPLAFTSVKLQFDVKLDGCRQVIFRIQDSIPEHICSVRLHAAGFSAQKDDHDHQGPDVATPFGNVSLPIPRGQWKTVQVEIADDRLTATIDGQEIRGRHALLKAEKATLEWVVSGQSASFRNVRVWKNP